MLGEPRKIWPWQAAGPDGEHPRLPKACTLELGEPLQQVFNLSLRLGKVPTAHPLEDALHRSSSKEELTQRALRLPNGGLNISSDEDPGATLPELPQASGATC